eukprot:CAMPEP_0202046690 /NCGR_PEP_ID=MMETSP0963-20130614/1464_1 /ASSEMBLY_ACC=CAM_ASM_000494 /TAXON_ID=4773 /ORGANISM="Schizochytrium aggregatum, Strain ATCC28209" /LENGTH=200 /DNA_ID=CAMNT_0048611359 /DNA_START=39 /DNA_END=639 /DNA_ORIENTATION=+
MLGSAREQAVTELVLGVRNGNAGRVCGVLSRMGVEEAEDVVVIVHGLFRAVARGDRVAAVLLQEVVAKHPLGHRQLAVAVLACLRREASDGTYELAQQLLAISGVAPLELALELQDLLHDHNCPRDQLVRFWHDNLEETDTPLPEESFEVAFDEVPLYVGGQLLAPQMGPSNLNKTCPDMHILDQFLTGLLKCAPLSCTP